MVGDKQKTYYDKRFQLPSFAVNDKVWLSIPITGKLEP